MCRPNLLEIFGLMVRRTIGFSDYWSFGPMVRRNIGMSPLLVYMRQKIRDKINGKLMKHICSSICHVSVGH